MKQSFNLDGGWSDWGKWSICSAVCGGGFMTRDRLCNNPMPSLNGRSCVGTDKDVTACNGDQCPGN